MDSLYLKVGAYHKFPYYLFNETFSNT